MRKIPRMAAVVFDCDSTLTAVEGIDALAAERRDEIAAMTDAAMRGELPLDAVYGRRLELIRPTRSRVDGLAQQYIDALVPDAAEVVAALHEEGIRVCIMSGGLTPAVRGLAKALEIAASDVAAVDIWFDERGDYAGFDDASPLARAGGKGDVLAGWRDTVGTPIMMVGDGATDLEASAFADVFVAYAGVIERAPVTSAADVVVRSRSLAPVLALALGGSKPQSAAARFLCERGLELLEPEYRSFIQPDG